MKVCTLILRGCSMRIATMSDLRNAIGRMGDGPYSIRKESLMKDVKGSKSAGKIDALDAEFGFSANDVLLLDATAKNLKDLRKADKAVIRNNVRNAAYQLLFGIFDKGAFGGGTMVGTAVKACVKAMNGGKPMKARTVTQSVLEKITTVAVLAALDAYKAEREAKIGSEAKAQVDAKIISQADADKWMVGKRNELSKGFMRAQEWLNRSWARVPAAMNAIRALSGGHVKTSDGETKPVDLAFEMILLNRAETASQFAKVVIRG